MAKNFFRRLTKKFFIITNLVLALIFLLGCYGGNLNPKSWWFIGLVTLSVFYLFILLLGFIVFWIITKPRWSLISLVAIAAAFPALTRVLPLRFSAPFSMIKDSASLRVMNWNVEHFDILEHRTHPENKEKMLNLIREYNPDVACFQEMVGSETKQPAINFLPDILDYLKFSDHFYSYNPKLDFDGAHHFGLIIFSKYPLINKQTIGFYPYDYNSIFQYADMVRGGDTFRIFNAHLQSLRFSSDNLKYIDSPEFEDKEAIRQSRSIIGKFKVGFLKRMVQADRIRAEMDKSPYPMIVCGDFNDVPNSYAYLTIGKGMRNAFEERGAGIGRTFSGISPTLRIDNIFTSKNLQIRQYARVSKKLSDHFPIFADLGLEKK